jgi:hypothetical protein
VNWNRRCAEALREARDLMNSGGRHWVKGAEHMLVDPLTHEPGEHGVSTGYRNTHYAPHFEDAYCSIGALHQVRADDLAAITLAEVIDPGEMTAARDRLVEDAEAEWEFEYEYYKDSYESKSEYVAEFVGARLVDDAEGVIVQFNDDARTAWSDVRSAFTKAARRLSQRKAT